MADSRLTWSSSTPSVQRLKPSAVQIIAELKRGQRVGELLQHGHERATDLLGPQAPVRPRCPRPSRCGWAGSCGAGARRSLPRGRGRAWASSTELLDGDGSGRELFIRRPPWSGWGFAVPWQRRRTRSPCHGGRRRPAGMRASHWSMTPRNSRNWGSGLWCQPGHGHRHLRRGDLVGDELQPELRVEQGHVVVAEEPQHHAGAPRHRRPPDQVEPLLAGGTDHGDLLAVRRPPLADLETHRRGGLEVPSECGPAARSSAPRWWTRRCRTPCRRRWSCPRRRVRRRTPVGRWGSRRLASCLSPEFANELAAADASWPCRTTGSRSSAFHGKLACLEPEIGPFGC